MENINSLENYQKIEDYLLQFLSITDEKYHFLKNSNINEDWTAYKENYLKSLIPINKEADNKKIIKSEKDENIYKEMQNKFKELLGNVQNNTKFYENLAFKNGYQSEKNDVFDRDPISFFNTLKK